jgi:hypothetical protein
VARGVYCLLKGQQSPELHMKPSVYVLLIIPISYPSQFPQWHKLVSTPEAVVGAHAQSQVEAVILHTLFTTFTVHSHLFFGACHLTQTPTSKWCGLNLHYFERQKNEGYREYHKYKDLQLQTCERLGRVAISSTVAIAIEASCSFGTALNTCSASCRQASMQVHKLFDL